MESNSDDRQSASNTERLVLVSDTSTEAERLIACLRVRKFKVRDVPLMLLAGRVEAQKPMLVIGDGLAARVVEAVTKMRQGQWGAKVDLLVLGGDAKTLEALRPMVADLDACSFSRPIDVYSVLQRVEEILGEPEGAASGGRRSMASLPRVGHNSISSPGRMLTPPPRRGRSSVPQSSPKSEQTPLSIGKDPELASSVRLPSIAPASEPSSPDSSSAGASVGRMSDELEQLLQDAERRLAPGPMALPFASLPAPRMTPEQELDAILPADVLAALDEPVDMDDDDETSHPTGRKERPSTMAPREAPASLFSRGMSSVDGLDEQGARTHASDEHTPIGRMGQRRPLTGSGSEPPDDESSSVQDGSVLTPVPASVKTHNTHGSQVSSSFSLSSAGGSSTSDGATAPRMALGERERTGSATGAGTFAHRPPSLTNDASAFDSMVPGTNPEFSAHSVGGSSDVSSTTPPHPPRSVHDPAHLWASMDEGVAHGPASTFDAPRADVGQKSTEANSTSPPHGALSRAMPFAIPLPESATPATSLEREASFSHEPRSAAATRVTSDSRAAPEPEYIPEPRVLIEPRLLIESRSTQSVGRDGPPPLGAAEGRPSFEIPTALAKGDVVRALARCVQSRYSGALAIEDETGIRRIVMREGDFVMVASGVDGESLVAFLIQRCDLNADAGRLTRKLPQFGRHAGAALIAHGYLRQDELWPVLRAHAEWLLGRAIGVEQGAASLEVELSARLQAEPAVFGGATGAEVLVEIVRRVVTPEVALDAMGGSKIRIRQGKMIRLLSECALTSGESQLAERATGLPLGELVRQAESPDFASAIYALVELSVLETLAPTAEVQKKSERPPPRDGLDDDAVRSRVALRRALVDEGDYFALLGVAHEATGYELRHAYLSLRREFEPAQLLSAATAGLREDVDLIVEVLDEAYDVLRDPARRDRYRRALDASPR